VLTLVSAGFYHYDIHKREEHMAMARTYPINVSIDLKLWKEVKQVAGNRKGSEALNEAMKMWLDKKENKR
jgi:hypothetical protein